MRFTAEIKDGKIHWHDRASIKQYFEDCEGEYYIDIKPSNTRNTAQNNFYWALLRDWGRAIGYDSEELHEVVKSKFKISSVLVISVSFKSNKDILLCVSSNVFI